MASQVKNEQIFQEASKYIPGGVNTAPRKTQPPLAIVRAAGPRLFDADGNSYLDYHAAFGGSLLGHCPPSVTKRVHEILDEIDLVGIGITDLEIQVAKKIVKHIPSAEKALVCTSGSEATYHAVRLSRAVTGRQKLIKFQGCFHGWHDYLLRNILSAPEMVDKRDPGSAGMLEEAIDQTLVCTFNDLDNVEQTIKQNAGEVAAIILEPIPHNVGCLMPKPGFLEGLRQLATDNGIILVFDEVITGFRHDLGGYQKICGVTPDLTAMGKSMANGFPVAAIAGKAELMDRFATQAGGDVFYSGTYNGHPVTMAAALAVIETLEDEPVHEHIFRLGEKARQGMREITERLGIPAIVAGFGSVFVTYFMTGKIETYTDLLRNDADLFVRFRRGLIDRGIFCLPNNIKRNHVSYAHTDADIDFTLQACEDTLKELVK
jgi:glutamate-1-semialdehyde 2,1-aminomutase